LSSQSLKLNESDVKSIPKGWEIVQIGDHFDFKNGLNKAKEFFGQGTPIINYMDVYPNSSIESKNIRGKVTVTNNELRTFGVRKGDVIFTRTSETIEEIGLSSAVLDDVDKTVFSGFLLRARPKTTLFELEFKKYCFRSKNVRMQIISKSSKTTRALTNGKLLSKVSVLIPNNPQEQKNIAESISDIEKLIDTLEILIKKKKNIKQGTTQELLTGSKRLSGFEVKQGNKKTEMGIIPKDWNISYFENHFDIFSGIGFKKSEYTQNGIKLLRIDNVSYETITWESEAYVPIQYLKKFPKIVLEEGDILLALNRPITNGKLKIAILEKKDIPSILYQRVGKIIFLNRNDDEKFLFYVLQKYIKKFVEETSVGTDQPFISTTKLKKLKLLLPTNPKEQFAIGTILINMDSEIKELETKRDKYLMIKNGMMQKLLTGEIRLT
jgi:type I restriction enzyme, S subunit